MSDLLKKGIILGLIGAAAGIGIGLVITLAGIAGGEAQGSIPELILYFFMSGMLGFVNMGASVMYNIEHWSIARATGTHFTVSIISFYVFGFAIHWLDPGEVMFYIITAIFIVVYFIIWLIQYIRYKKEIRKINDDLKRFRSNPDKKTSPKDE